MPTYAYAYNSYKKGKLRVYLLYKLKVLKVSEAHAPLGPPHCRYTTGANWAAAEWCIDNNKSRRMLIRNK